MGELTTISISKKTKEKLEVLKIIPRESYDSLMNRLIAQFSDKRGDNVQQ